jgi:hypothetical protein
MITDSMIAVYVVLQQYSTMAVLGIAQLSNLQGLQQNRLNKLLRVGGLACIADCQSPA